ncbi:DUF4258 domain-containing protein [Azoarcus sp. DN11]|uniref:DUF4258 domain-containing protein n=1 Tax=Azoarcus sp. DN11 TaxID=356837 RepID=UPI000EAE175C|nr:DUF4258 domain-containing protein [Azoarcus sp. DN11]AYH45785.1 hypothetical protein CDA09_20775 [Azoarcus sp. DN11]
MTPIESFPPSEHQARQWMQEAAEGRRRLLFSLHAEERMQQRKIGRRQIIQVLRTGTVSEPLHQDVRGDWRCNVSGRSAGMRLTVGVVLKQKPDGAWVVVATAFEGE